MGLKGGVFSAMTGGSYFTVHSHAVYRPSRGETIKVYIDGTALLYIHLLAWKNDQGVPAETVTNRYCQKINLEIRKLASKLEFALDYLDLHFLLTFDDQLRRPPNKEKRKFSVDIQSQVNSYLSYLRNVKDEEENIFGHHKIILLPIDEDEAGHGYCGESDFRIVNAIDDDYETPCHIICSNDSDYFAFSYRRNQNLFFFNPKTEASSVYDLSQLSMALDYTLVPIAAIRGCDYGRPTILGKDKSDLGKQLKELLAPTTSYENLLKFDKMVSNHLQTIRRVGTDEFINSHGVHCCEVDILKRFVLYFNDLYHYYINLQPFTMSSEYFNWKICRRDAYMCILLYLHYRPVNCPSQLFLEMDRLFKPRYVYHYKVSSSLFKKGNDEEVDRRVYYIREKSDTLSTIL